MSISPHPPAKILNIYIVALTGFSHVPNPDISTPHFNLKAVSLEQLLGAGEASGKHLPRRGGSGEPPIAWVQLMSQQVARLLDDLLQQ